MSSCLKIKYTSPQAMWEERRADIPLWLLAAGVPLEELPFCPAVLVGWGLSCNLPFSGTFTCQSLVCAGHRELHGLPPSRPSQNWWKIAMVH